VGNEPGRKVVRDIMLAFVRVHVLHHACEGRIFGLEMMEELRRHGYDIGPSTLYPLLHALERGGILVSEQELVDGKGRRYYRSTDAGVALLAELRELIREMVDEVVPAPAKGRNRRPTRHAAKRRTT